MGNKIQTRTYKERSQLSSRSKLGLLEKHKDYVLRAKDFNLKKRRLKALKEKSANRNPDEFYFKMIASKTRKDGTHSAKSNQISEDVLKVMKSQDLNYISFMRKIEAKQIEKLQSCVYPEENVPRAEKHIFFVDRLEDPVNDIQPILQANDNIEKTKKELEARKERESKLKLAEDKLNQERVLRQKGSKLKIGTDPRGLPIYKWKNERKK